MNNTNIPAQNPEQNQAEILDNLIREVTALGDREDLSDYEKVIKELLTTIHDCDKLEAECQELKVTPFNKGMPQ